VFFAGRRHRRLDISKYVIVFICSHPRSRHHVGRRTVSAGSVAVVRRRSRASGSFRSRSKRILRKSLLHSFHYRDIILYVYLHAIVVVPYRYIIIIFVPTGRRSRPIVFRRCRRSRGVLCYYYYYCVFLIPNKHTNRIHTGIILLYSI